MKKLRLTEAEQKLMLEDIMTKFKKSGNNPNGFEYTSKDIAAFLDRYKKEDIKKPTLRITAEAYTAMYELVKQSPVEIQWHMMVVRNLEDQIYTVYDVLLYPQVNSGASTTTDQDEFTEWQTDLITNPDFPIEELRGHGHSHVNMSVYSSNIDDAYQKDLITKVENGDFYLFLVLNKKMEMFALLYDFDQQIVFETSDMDIQIISSEGINIREWCKEQIKANCKTAVKSTRYTGYYPAKDKEDDLIANIAKAGNFFGRRK